MLQLFLKMLYFIGYMLLIGPPRAIEILDKANNQQGELAGQSLWQVIVIEFVVRSGLFLIVAVLVEALVGDLAFEIYKMDLFFAALILAGVVYSLFYFIAFGLNPEKIGKRCRLYRIGRNFSYAVVPAFPAAGLALFWQQINQQTLFSGNLVSQVFLLTWGIFILAGLIEALIVFRQPMGLDEKLQEKLSSSV